MKTYIKNISLYLLTLLTITLTTASSQAADISIDENRNPIVHLEDDEVAIFGYGSLMLCESLEDDLEHLYTGPFIQCHLNNFTRSWSANYLLGPSSPSKSITSLNIESKQGEIINGMLFVIKKSELANYDYRESNYNRLQVNDLVTDVTIQNGPIYTYSAKPQHTVHTENLSHSDTFIAEDYVEIINEALAILGDDFADEFRQSTQPTPENLVHHFYL